MGGAHGLETKLCSNYDLTTGEKLTLNDLFTPKERLRWQGIYVKRF